MFISYELNICDNGLCLNKERQIDISGSGIFFTHTDIIEISCGIEVFDTVIYNRSHIIIPWFNANIRADVVIINGLWTHMGDSDLLNSRIFIGRLCRDTLCPRKRLSAKQ